ncbi:hypothetical protein [Massilia aurea]|nr:hypothetical protein [Massilia aurea]
MITTIVLRVFERMHDRKLASIIATAGQNHVCDRTIRNWLSKRTGPNRQLLAEIMVDSQEQLRANLEEKAWPAEEIQAFIDGLKACTGLVSGVAFGLQNRCDQYPALLRLAAKIDLLEQKLGEHRANQDVRGWANTILDAKWIQDEQFEDPDTGTSAECTRQQLRQAQAWEELERPAAVFFVNTLFQLLATLDLEFGATYLAEWEATPFFAALLPRLNPRIDLEGKVSIRTTRNFYHYPTRRLLDATACMRIMRQSPLLKWPNRIPAAAKMVEWLQLRNCATLASNVAKWRSGRPLTAARFDELWDACFDFVPAAHRPSAPIPMLFAATLFSELFVQGSLAERNLTFVSPDPAFYLYWWKIQRQALESGSQALRFGTKPWMPALSV